MKTREEILDFIENEYGELFDLRRDEAPMSVKKIKHDIAKSYRMVMEAHDEDWYEWYAGRTIKLRSAYERILKYIMEE